MKIFALSGNVTGFLQIEWEENVSEIMDLEEPRRKSGIWGTVSLQTIKRLDKKGTPLGDCPYFSPGNALIVSENLMKLILSFTGDELEFLPVKIDGKCGYSWMNVLCVIDALDEEKSELERFESSGRIMYVIQSRYRDDVINGHHIFRLPNYAGVFITEALKAYLEANRVRGVTYSDTTERVENPFAELFEKKQKKEARRSAAGDKEK